MTRFPAHVSAVSPLRDAIDGSRRPRPRRSVRTLPPETSTRYMCPWCGRIDDDPAESRRHLAREMATDRGQLAPPKRERQRLPGEGSVSRYVMRDGTIRWMIKFADRGEMVVRRLAPNGERWTSYAAAEQALHDALAREPYWIGPDGKYLSHRDDIEEQQRDQAAWDAFRRGGLKAARESRGLSLKELDRRSGVDRRQIRGFERGTRPSGASLLKVADALGLLDGISLRDVQRAWPG